MPLLSSELYPMQSVALARGDATEIASVLKDFWASEHTISKAMSSFDFAKIPGQTVSQVEWWYEIGWSFLPESRVTHSLENVGTTKKNFAKVMAANDERFAVAA